MSDIGYSGQYLDNKQFRIKVRTGEDIANVTGDAICGEMFLVTGSNPGLYIATETSTKDSHSIYIVQSLNSVQSGPYVTSVSTPNLVTNILLHTLAIKSDGSLWAMGKNNRGQLGDGSDTDSLTFKKIINSGVSQISAGLDHSLFLKNDGTLWGMGENGRGQLGQGNTTGYNSPVQIASDVSQISAGSASFFVKTDGTLWGVGYNDEGQLGTGDTQDKLTPIQIDSEVSFVSASAASFVMYRKNDGSIWGIGSGQYGVFNNGSETAQNTKIQVIASSEGVEKFSVGVNYAIFLKSNGEVWGTGNDQSKQLNGTTNLYLNNFTKILNINNSNPIQEVFAGGQCSHLLTSQGLWAFGTNYYGELGVGSSDTSVNSTLIPGGVFACGGSYRSFVIKNDGELYAAGQNNLGQLGDGTTTDQNTLTLINF